MNTQMKTFNSNFCRILLASCFGALWLVALGTQAATITVTSYAGVGAGTLHQALADANDGDTINFALAPPAYIQLYADPLEVDKSVTISGPGAANLTVLGTNGTRVFNIAVGKTVTISGLTITNGFAQSLGGGGIFNDHSTLTLNNCNIVNNFTTGVGAGIYNTGTLAINNCSISNNHSIIFLGSEGAGGGVYNDGRSGSATITVTNSTISNNDSEGAGGGIYNNGGEGIGMLTVVNSTVNNNSAGYDGGGIYNAGIEGSEAVTMNNSTLSNNSSGSLGGGIANYGLGFSANAAIAITNSTLSNNSATGGGGISNKADGHGRATLTINNSTLSGNSAGDGGGISNVGVSGGVAALIVENNTLSGNSANYGGGIYNATPLGAAILTIGGSILKTGDSGENIYSGFGTVISDGYNLSNDECGGLLTGTGDQINTDPMLGPLQDNGGPTFTHELLDGSPAIDAGDPSFTPPPNYDQRGSGFSRVVNGRVDIGAFEVQPPTPSYAAQVQAPINADGTSTFNVRRGVVPVKFNVTLGGVATCDLPPATIAVTRTAGGVIGEINESVYSGNADSGSAFRIDSCQYLYNLNSRALGVGTYRVDILIDGQVVGNAVFGLN